jgi:hypothetical protein
MLNQSRANRILGNVVALRAEILVGAEYSIEVVALPDLSADLVSAYALDPAHDHWKRELLMERKHDVHVIRHADSAMEKVRALMIEDAALHDDVARLRS